jgi:Uma2 family endonuclease
MEAAPKQRMTVDEFLDWTSSQDDGRYELLDGLVVAMAPERADHGRGKFDAATAFWAAIIRGGVPCEAFVDTLAVRIDAGTSFVPDVLVNCGERIAGGDMLAARPVIVVEVLSPSTKHIDKAQKLLGYFQVPGLIHYLIVDIEKRAIIHHRRKNENLIETTLIRNGTIALDPPGIAVEAEQLLG